MNTMKRLWIFIIALVVLIVFWAGASYNGLIKKDQGVKSKWSAVEGQYQRRADLIPNLVSTVKGAANFEQETLQQVVEARAKATAITISADQLTPENIAKYQNAQTELSGALGRLLAVAESYPQLQAVQAFRDLQVQLEGTENRIAVARKDFTDAVQVYNTAIHTFPRNILAGIFGFSEKGYFTADAGSDKAPQVDFTK